MQKGTPNFQIQLEQVSAVILEWQLLPELQVLAITCAELPAGFVSPMMIDAGYYRFSMLDNVHPQDSRLCDMHATPGVKQHTAASDAALNHVIATRCKCSVFPAQSL